MFKPLLRLALFASVVFVSICSVRAATIYLPYSFRTVAGIAPGNVDGAGANARFTMVAGMTSDSAGNIYLVDQVASTVRKVTPSGVVTTIAGFAGYNGTADGVGAAARFRNPRDIAIDPAGNLYVADTGNSTIRKITPDGTVSTIAGAPGKPAYQDGTGLLAHFNGPGGVAWVGDKLFISDTNDSVIRAMDANGTVTTFAGKAGVTGSTDATGANARFYAPAGLRADAGGNLFVADQFANVVREVTPAAVVTTIAGVPTKAGNQDGPGSSALFNVPRYLALDPSGNIYVSDVNNVTIRKIAPDHSVSTFIPPGPFAGVLGIAFADNNLFIGDPANGAIFISDLSGNAHLFAGNPSAGESDGTGSQARFWQPTAVATDSNDNVYVADARIGTVREITQDGQVSTIATGQFSTPQGIAVDNVGNVYVVNTATSNIVRVAPGGAVTPFAGSPNAVGTTDATGTAARFRNPTALAIDASGNLYVADTGNHTIRKITPSGAVSTFAGNPGVAGANDGTGTSATFYGPQGVAVDGSGDVFVADTFNQIVRKVSPSGAVTTIAGNANTAGADDAAGTHATFTNPVGIAVDKSGNVFVAEQYGETIRRIAPDGTVRTVAGVHNVAGSSDGAGAAALFDTPMGLAIDSIGRIYVADSSNNVIRASSPGPVSQMLNISTRGLVGTNTDVLIGGVISVGSTNKSVLLRAIGPSLGGVGVTGALADPVLELHDSSGALIATNDNWKTDAATGGSQESAIRGTGVPPANDSESALLATLAPDQNYTVIVRGNNNGTGVALVEVYDLDAPSGTARLANISTRGVVEANPNLLIGGVIVGGQSGSSNVLVRAIGPSLVAAGVGNALLDPTLELHDANGSLIAYDDNWKDSNAAAIQATGIPPADDREAAILASLPGGNYTAVVSGKNGGTGVALVEAYNVP